MAATLITVVASQVPKLDGNLAAVAAVPFYVPFYMLFLAVMAIAGLAVAV